MLNCDGMTVDNSFFSKVMKRPLVVHAKKIDEDFMVTTMEGIVTGKPGDYLMVGVRGEKYPCAKEIFEATYDILT